MGFVDLFFFISCPAHLPPTPPSVCQSLDEHQEKKVVHDQRLGLMPNLETWNFLFSCRTFQSEQESEQASALSHPTFKMLDASAKEEGVSLVSGLLSVESVN